MPSEGLQLPAATAAWLVDAGLVAPGAVLPARGDAVRLDEETSARFETGTVRGGGHRVAGSARDAALLRALTVSLPAAASRARRCPLYARATRRRPQPGGAEPPPARQPRQRRACGR
jgi:hypothetical protein